MRNVEIARAADRSGFKYVWCPQHHFLDEYSHMPGPEAFLSFCAAQTERVHLGSAIFNITPPVNKPVRVAENVALLDHLTGNRFEFGTGRGSSTTEVHGFDIDDINETKAMWREAITEIPKMWKDGVYSYEGTYFRVPERQVFPKPYGPVHPAMWVAAGSPPTFTEAGEMGLGAFCFSMGRPAQIAPLVANYKNAIGNATPVGDYVNDNIMGVTNMLCMEDRNKAFETAANMGMNYYTSLAFHWLDNIPKPKGLPVWPDQIPEPTPEDVEKLTDGRLRRRRRPRRLRQALQPLGGHRRRPAHLQPDHQHAAHRGRGRRRWSCSAARSSPQFDKDPVHSTTRYREARPRLAD